MEEVSLYVFLCKETTLKDLQFGMGLKKYCKFDFLSAILKPPPKKHKPTFPGEVHFLLLTAYFSPMSAHLCREEGMDAIPEPKFATITTLIFSSSQFTWS